MTREEIIAMAREEGLSFVPDTNSPFARIVRKAVAKEREAAAQVAAPAAIRARGQKEGA